MTTWRTGTDNPHALYRDNVFAGMVSDPTHGAELMEAANDSVERTASELRREREQWEVQLSAAESVIKSERAETARLREELDCHQRGLDSQRHELELRLEEAENELESARAELARMGPCLEGLRVYFEEQIEVTDSPGTLQTLRIQLRSIRRALTTPPAPVSPKAPWADRCARCGYFVPKGAACQCDQWPAPVSPECAHRYDIRGDDPNCLKCGEPGDESEETSGQNCAGCGELEHPGKCR